MAKNVSCDLLGIAESSQIICLVITKVNMSTAERPQKDTKLAQINPNV